MDKPRYFIRSRRQARKLSDGRAAIGFREMDAAEAEPHLRALEKRERREIDELDQYEEGLPK